MQSGLASYSWWELEMHKLKAPPQKPACSLYSVCTQEGQWQNKVDFRNTSSEGYDIKT